MEELDSDSKVNQALGKTDDQEEEKKEESKNADNMQETQQSFYRKQGIDFLNFQRPGTAYDSSAFKQAAANSTSTSFYAKSSIIPAKKAEIKSKPMNQLWIDRADKILDHVNHLYSLLEFIDYGCQAANRQLNQYKPRLLKNKTEEQFFSSSQKLVHEINSLYELYQTFQPDYDVYDVANQAQLVLFTEKFEHQVKEIEAKMTKIARGQDPYEGVAGKSFISPTMQLT